MPSVDGSDIALRISVGVIIPIGAPSRSVTNTWCTFLAAILLNTSPMSASGRTDTTFASPPGYDRCRASNDLNSSTERSNVGSFTKPRRSDTLKTSTSFPLGSATTPTALTPSEYISENASRVRVVGKTHTTSPRFCATAASSTRPISRRFRRVTSPRSFWCASRNRITSDWDTTASMIIVSSMTDASYASLYTATRWQYVALRGIAATDGGPRGPGPGPGPSPGILSIVFPPSPSARLTAAHSPGFGFASEPRFASSSSSRAATHAASSASCPGATITLKNPARTRSSIGVSDLPWYTIRPSSFPERRSRKSPSAVSQNARPAVASSSAVMDAIHIVERLELFVASRRARVHLGLEPRDLRGQRRRRFRPLEKDHEPAQEVADVVEAEELRYRVRRRRSALVSASASVRASVRARRRERALERGERKEKRSEAKAKSLVAPGTRLCPRRARRGCSPSRASRARRPRCRRSTASSPVSARPRGTSSRTRRSSTATAALASSRTARTPRAAAWSARDRAASAARAGRRTAASTRSRACPRTARRSRSRSRSRSRRRRPSRRRRRSVASTTEATPRPSWLPRRGSVCLLARRIAYGRGEGSARWAGRGERSPTTTRRRSGAGGRLRGEDARGERRQNAVVVARASSARPRSAPRVRGTETTKPTE
eukprot:29262-Pelagococcus_subviridis.AAC.6